MPTNNPDSGAVSAEDLGASALSTAALAYAEDWLDEPEAVRIARAKADELGCSPIPPSVASLLTFLSITMNAQAIVEVGTGTGVSGAALLAGSGETGVLTSIDAEAENQRAARETLVALGYDHVRTRLIAGRAMDVLPRLADGAYDLMFVDGDHLEFPAVLAQAERLLRTGGIVVFNGILQSGAVPDHSRRDPEAVALRSTIHAVRDDDGWHPVLLTVGGGLLVAIRRPAPKD
jgi:predicted O-methyltransferase YrrM